MKITKNRDLTAEEIAGLSIEETEDIYFERIEEWILGPMDILTHHDHTGWAVLQLAKMVGQMLQNTSAPISYINLLLNPHIVLDGDFEKAIDTNGTFVRVNPLRLPDYLRGEIAEARKAGDTAVDMEGFRKMLYEKAKKYEETENESGEEGTS